MCISESPPGAIENDLRTNTAVTDRNALIIDSPQSAAGSFPIHPGMFNRSIAARVVSTGCSAYVLKLVQPVIRYLIWSDLVFMSRSIS